MTVAERLFHEFQSVDRFQLALDTNEAESVHLEFKEVYDFKGKLEDHHKHLMHKAIGAMANALGGVVVWGVKSNQRGEVRTVTELKPIKGLNSFFQRLTSYDPTALAIPGLQSVMVPYGATDEGFVVTLVPECPVKPRMSSDGAYYYRANDSSFTMDEQMVRGMILATAAPQLEIVWARQFYNPGHDMASFIGHVHVGGHVPARDLAFAVGQLPPTILQVHSTANGFGNVHMLDGESVVEGDLYIFGARVVYPGMILPLVRLNFRKVKERAVFEALVNVFAQDFSASSKVSRTRDELLSLPPEDPPRTPHAIY